LSTPVLPCKHFYTHFRTWDNIILYRILIRRQRAVRAAWKPREQCTYHFFFLKNKKYDAWKVSGWERRIRYRSSVFEKPSRAFALNLIRCSTWNTIASLSSRSVYWRKSRRNPSLSPASRQYYYVVYILSICATRVCDYFQLLNSTGRTNASPFYGDVYCPRILYFPTNVNACVFRATEYARKKFSWRFTQYYHVQSAKLEMFIDRSTILTRTRKRREPVKFVITHIKPFGVYFFRLSSK